MEKSNSEILPGPAKFTCTKCGAGILCHTHAQAKTIACVCGSVYKIGGKELKFDVKISPLGYLPVIQLGSTGVFEGTEYLVTAFVVKRDPKYNYRWREYTLFNPVVGYRFLSEYDGHWMFIDYCDKNPEFDQHATEIKYGLFAYRLYAKYQAKIVQVLGEWSYDITEDNKVKTHEYINPPEIIIREFSKDELCWLRGRYIEPDQVRQSFVCSELPQRNGIGVIQPQTFSFDYFSVLRLTIAAVLVLLAGQILFDYNSSQKEVLDFSQWVNDSTAGKSIVSPSFDLKNGTKNISYHLFSDVDNNWLETDITLVNEKTGEDLDFSQGVEYYHGYDDGNWSEGSKATEAVIESVPEGTYHLLITPLKDYTAHEMHYSIRIVRDVPTWSNLWKAIGVLSVIPLIQFYRSRSFEKKRWMDSDYSPFITEEE